MALARTFSPKTLCLLAAVAMLCSLTVVRADNTTSTEDDTFDAPPLVVTPTRYRRERLSVPASVTVITADEIASAPALNIDDILRTVPGVSLMQVTGMGQGMPSRLNIRGVPGSHRTLLLVDGVPLNEAATRFMSINEIPVRAVEQVEVVRGPYSSLYGTDAFGGVINIITAKGTGEPDFGFTVGAGSENYYSVEADVAGGAGNATYQLSFGKRSIDNYLARSYVIDRQYDYAARQYVDTVKDEANNDYEDVRAMGSLTFSLGEKTSLRTFARFFEGELGYGRKDVAPLYPTAEDNITRTRTAIVGGMARTVVGPKIDMRIGAYVRDQKRELWGLDVSHFNGSLPVYARSFSENVCREWQAESGVDIELGENNTLSAGIDVRQTACRFYPLKDDATRTELPGVRGADEDVWNSSVYVQDEASLGERCTVMAGVRLDVHSEFGSAVSPRAGVAYDVSEATTLRASVGKAFRAPTLVELFQPDVSFGYVTFRSNPDLEAENILAADIEVEHRFSPSIRARLCGFYNDMDNLVANSISGSFLSNVNIDDARSVGLEAELLYRLNDKANAFLACAFQDAKDKNTEGPLEYIPETTASAGLRLGTDLGKWRMAGSLTGLYAGDRGFTDWSSGQWYNFGDYWRADVGVRGTYNDMLWLGLNVRNATDEKYQESNMSPLAPGRVVTVEAGARY